MKYETSKPISMELLDLIEWISEENNTEYERGMLTGLRIAEQLVEAVERNSEVTNDAAD